MNIENVEIPEPEINPFLKNYQDKSLNSKVSALIDHQTKPGSGFPTLISNEEKYKESSFGSVKIDELDFCIFYNPTRTKNVRASTFTVPDQNFQCFLCDLLPGQRGIKVLNNSYMIIVNPGITIPGDLTIPTIHHELQKLESHFLNMLDIAAELTDYSLFFNGPLAGATCPHFHFQAGIRDKLPGEQQINRLLTESHKSPMNKDYLFQDHRTEIFKITNFLRSNYCIFSSSKPAVLEFADHFFKKIKSLDQKYIRKLPHIPDFGSVMKVFGEAEEEGRFNVMAKYYSDQKKYLAVFFPKIFNRPQLYFSKGPYQLTLGFAIKEALGHVLVTSKEDLHRIMENTELLRQAYLDTNLTDEMDRDLFQNLKGLYS
ncbi:MAG: DUF4922 domain-containing protein [Candidatus Marinimicrobia bacterium]|nr:DUF4922 domain-containing protein [Candidatus Neomarinimicrobiota bacterium]